LKAAIFRAFDENTTLREDNIKASVMTGLVEGVRNCGRPRISWINDIIA